MFFNLRYHIISLVAVFLALGLGILIGSTVLGSEALVGQQQQLTNSLETRISALSQKNKLLQARIQSLEMDSNIQRQFGSQALPVLVAGRLEGRSIALIQTSGQDLPEGLLPALEAAGAAIQSTTVLNGLELPDRGTLLARAGWPALDDGALAARIAAETARAVLTGETGVINLLAAHKLVKTWGRYGDPVDDLIIIGGSREKSLVRLQQIDLPLIDLFRSRQVGVYGAEESCSAFSYMKEYQKKGIPTVDNIDTVPGLVSLIYAISGLPGQYGVKPSARALLPAMERGVQVNAGVTAR